MPVYQGRDGLRDVIRGEDALLDRVKPVVSYLGGVISDCKAGPAAEQNQVIPIGSIGPVANRLLDVEHVVWNDLDCGGFPLPLRGQDGSKSGGRLVGRGVLRGRVGDDQNGCLEFVHCEGWLEGKSGGRAGLLSFGSGVWRTAGWVSVTVSLVTVRAALAFFTDAGISRKFGTG